MGIRMIWDLPEHVNVAMGDRNIEHPAFIHVDLTSAGEILEARIIEVSRTGSGRVLDKDEENDIQLIMGAIGNGVEVVGTADEEEKEQ